MEGIFPLCLRGGAECRAEKVPVGVEQPLWGKPGTALPWRNQSKLKLRVSPREKLNSNSQVYPVTGRGWQLPIYQHFTPLTGPLLRTCLLQRPQPTKEALVQTLRIEPPQKLSNREEQHLLQHTNLKMGQS
jgi:hypothetical protein